MKSFIVSWHADGYCGTFRYMVVANTVGEAKEIWSKFVRDNKDIEYSWEKAERGVKNHHSGYIAWKENGNCDRKNGCYKMEFNAWSTGSDHLWD